MEDEFRSQSQNELGSAATQTDTQNLKIVKAIGSLKSSIYQINDFRKGLAKLPGAKKLKADDSLKESRAELMVAVDSALRDIPEELLKDIEWQEQTDNGFETYDSRLFESGHSPEEYKDALQWTIKSMYQYGEDLEELKTEVTQVPISGAKKEQLLTALDNAANNLCDLSRKLGFVLQEYH